MPLRPDPYVALGVDQSADIATIKTAYRKLVLKCHPDKVQDPTLKAAKQDEFQRVQQAYEILSDDNKRRDYDEDVRFRSARDDMPRAGSRARPSPAAHREPHIFNAEPRSSFKPGPPPPTSPYGHYGAAYTGTFEVPLRPSPYADAPPRSSRRTSPVSKARDDLKDDRRRRKDDSESYGPRERERNHEREREREREKGRERERKEKDKAREREERQRRDRERDRTRRQETVEKTRSKKEAYMDDYVEFDTKRSMPKKSSSGGMGSSARRRSADSPRKSKAATGDASSAVPSKPDYVRERMTFAQDYMRRAPQTSAKAQFSDEVPYQYVYAEHETWHSSTDPLRASRSSRDETRDRGRYGASDLPPPLPRSYTTSTMYGSGASPRAPSLSRAATGLGTYSMPEAPPVPSMPTATSMPLGDSRHSESRHSRKSDRLRRDYFDDFDMADLGRRPARAYETPVRVSRYGDYASSPIGGSAGRPVGKVRESPMFDREHVSERKPLSPADIKYSPMPDIKYSTIPRASTYAS